MTYKVDIFGAGGHARSIIALLKDQNIEVLGVYDDNFDDNQKESIGGIALKGRYNTCSFNNPVVLALGDNKKRAALFQSLNEKIYRDPIVHSTAYLDMGVQIGVANLIFPKVVINTEVVIGDNNIINTGSIIEHETIIGSNNHISIGSVIAGRCSIGNNCFIGAGAVIIDGISVCDDVIIGANSVVTKSIRQPGTYVGIPAKLLEK